jgi:hypothetical protein
MHVFHVIALEEQVCLETVDTISRAFKEEVLTRLLGLLTARAQTRNGGILLPRTTARKPIGECKQWQ